MDGPNQRLAGIDYIEEFGFVPLAATFDECDSADHAYTGDDASAAQAGELSAAQWQTAPQMDSSGHPVIGPKTFDATSSVSPSAQSGLQVNSLSPSTLSPATISSGTVGGPSPEAVPTSSSIKQYNHAEPSKARPNGKRVTKRRRKDAKSRPSATRRNVMTTEADPKCMIKTDDNGNIIGALTTFGLNETVRAQMTNAERLSSAVTRQLGACHKCKMKKQRCNMTNEYEACGRCLNHFRNFCMNTSTRHRFQPCITIDIEKLRLHRKGPMINTYIQDWTASKQQLLAYEAQSSSILLLLTQGFGEGETNALRLMVSRFEPIAGDRTAYFWTDPSGQQQSMEMPPYFISDLADARLAIIEFLRGSRPVYLETLLVDSDPLIRQTFEAALNYNAFNKSQLIEYALNSWVAARFIESHWHVFVGGYWMGVEPTNEPGHPYHGFIPVTPMMDTQLDDLVIRDLIEPLTTRFLRHLKSKIEEQNPANWLEIHFAIFIMVSNIGWITKDMASIAKWKGLKAGNRGGTLTQGYIHACKTMLSYFHFACAGPLRSLKLDGGIDSDARTKHWTPEQVEYIKHLQEEISHQESKINRWKELSMYEDPGYWCFQLLSSEWKGDVPHNGMIDDFREEDFLSSSGT